MDGLRDFLTDSLGEGFDPGGRRLETLYPSEFPVEPLAEIGLKPGEHSIMDVSTEGIPKIDMIFIRRLQADYGIALEEGGEDLQGRFIALVCEIRSKIYQGKIISLGELEMLNRLFHKRLRGLVLENVTVAGIDWRDVDLRDSVLGSVTIKKNTPMMGADLRGATLTHCTLDVPVKYMTGLNLEGARFVSTKMSPELFDYFRKCGEMESVSVTATF